MSPVARILCVGSAVLDLVFELPRHPAPDEELRADRLRIVPGGNAANTARVLRGLGHEVSLAAVLSGHPAAGPLEEGLNRAGVDLGPCRRVPVLPPLSAILLDPSGARTIVHHRATPEYGLDEFGRLDLARWQWLHLEARPGPETPRMVRHARAFHPGLPISIEVEKPRPGIEGCLAGARVALFSRPFAEARGFAAPEPFLEAVRREVPRTLLTVTWGADGAWGADPDGSILHAPAAADRVVDTIGAGDVFNAGAIDALARGRGFPEALAAGCALAGHKVGRVGLDLR